MSNETIRLLDAHHSDRSFLAKPVDEAILFPDHRGRSSRTDIDQRPATYTTIKTSQSSAEPCTSTTAKSSVSDTSRSRSDAESFSSPPSD